MNTVIYALMHFVVDFVCAWSMFGFFREGSGGYENLLIYNFCAFAMQMPLGTLLDVLGNRRGGKLPRLWAIGGGVLTLIGALLHPAVLGLGNALFHVGGGMDVIGEDFAKSRKGRDLGVFVAPGAVGLYLGTRLGKSDASMFVLAVCTLVLALLAVVLLKGRPHTYTAPETQGNGLALCLCCFAVVILRSYVGLSVSFPWKTGALFGWLAVAAVAFGKTAGGILAARFGMDRTIQFSLLLAAGCFLLGNIPVFGLAALLLFNMSMPVTLYLLACQLPRLPGFSFGLLTFGLFLGFLPVYAGVQLPVPGTVLGAVGSILSVLLLTGGRKAVRRVSA